MARKNILFQLLVFLSFCTACQSQASSDNHIGKKIDKIELEFYPSFTHSSKFSIDKNSSSIEIVIFNPKRLFEESEEEIIKHTSIEIKNKALLMDFVNTVALLKLDSNRIDERMILDGISGSVTKYNERIIQEKLLIKSPNRKEFELDYQILDAFFGLLDRELNEKDFLLEYSEKLKGYFDYGLPIKLINQDPLEFRIWGAITGNEVEELYVFFDTLPVWKPIIFDCTNFPGMGNMFHVDFEEINDSHQIYYLVKEDRIPRDLIEIGNCSIYTDRGRMNEKIQRENKN